MKIAPIFIILFLLAGCSGLGSVAVGVAGNVIGELIADEVKEKLKENKEKDGKEPT